MSWVDGSYGMGTWTEDQLQGAGASSRTTLGLPGPDWLAGWLLPAPAPQKRPVALFESGGRHIIALPSTQLPLTLLSLGFTATDVL